PPHHYSERVLVRPMRAGDVDVAERLTAEVFWDLHLRTRPNDWPPPQRRSSAGSAQWVRRMRHLLEHDGGGCWVAEDNGLVGVATSLRREGLWGLSAYAVLPRAQGAGVGAALLQAALGYSQGCLRGVICSSHDARAARRYRLAGFTLHPTMVLRGSVDRSALPFQDRVRDGSVADIDLCNSVDRQTRGAAHGADHEVMAAEMRLVVSDHTTGSGYCYIRGDGGAHLLAATNRRTATRLLWESLAAAGDGPVELWHVTAAQEWAVDVALAAGLEVHNRGYLALRTMRPPMPYLPSGHFL
ncbi:MAG TPA: GNAT family N-acetyltransferase, partial [Nocardioidaceae bacterium]|nr:GNAT family N-acetyltransferase [Nocardioidaceae bacterium]